MASGDSVEKIYQKKTQLEHILLRPDTYIGSVESVTQEMWVFDEDVGMNCREVTYVPGLYKIFDEILVNAADNKQRDKNMTKIKIDIKQEEGTIQVWNDGKGIPVHMHSEHKMYIPEMIFGHLLTSSNYDDKQKKVTGGRNGYGAKLCNIFSKYFTLETSSKEYKKKFKQTWTDNMGSKKTPKILQSDKEDYTSVKFKPDLTKFQMERLDKDIVSLMTRRAYDIAGCTPGIKVYLNGVRLPVSNFKSYVQLYLKNLGIEESNKIIHEKSGERWEVCLTHSEKGFRQVSFVNSIATTKGGRHVDHVMDQVVKKLTEVVKKKNKGGVDVKPFQIKNHCFVFVNSLIVNPTFDSQTKENMTLVQKKFGSKCELTDNFLKSAGKSTIVDGILNWVKFKAQTQLNAKSATKTSKLKGIPKLDDANDAGTKNSLNCTLILTEGDSAKTLAVSGLSVVGRDKWGVFPLRGKLLNARDANHKQVRDNAEINAIIKIMGLKYGKKYSQEDDLKSLRYGKLMIMTDQDHDGSHIKGLLINFIQHFWPELLQRRLLEEFITPIVKVTKGTETIPFYTLPEFEEWYQGVDRPHTWSVKYYKGLGTSTSKEAKSYFAEMNRHRIRFQYKGNEDDQAIDMAFNKKRADDRKDWLTLYMEERKRCRENQEPEPGSQLYSADTRALSYSDFVNKELVMFSCADLERSVPSFVDGLKPGQRKVLFTCLSRNDKKQVKVAQLSGSVAEKSAYHHGEASLQSTIINMAQNFVGSNNLNLLQPIGQFGTRLHGGKDAASPRYIFTMMSPLTRIVFPKVDENCLTWLKDDNQTVEPMWYCPIIPMILVNGSEGIGTGWSTKIPNHDIREVVANCHRFINGEELKPMKASYKNFKGDIQELEPNKYVISGRIAYLDDNTIEITELPIKSWTQDYKEKTLEPLVNGTEKTPAKILSYREYCTDTTIRFVVKFAANKLREAQRSNLYKFFNLQTSQSHSNTLTVFGEHGELLRYSSTLDIMKDFCKIRLRLYHERKDFMVGQLTAETKKITNQAKFVKEKVEKKISVLNKKKTAIVELLFERGYDSDPIKKWKKSYKLKTPDNNESSNEEDEVDEEKDYNYIMNMPIWSLTRERYEDLLKQAGQKQTELEELKLKEIKDLWREDLDEFLVELEKVEAKEREDELASIEHGVQGGGSGKKSRGKKKGGKKLVVKEETFPSVDGEYCEVVIDEAIKKRIADADKRNKKVKKEPKVEVKVEIKEEPYDPDKPTSLADRLKKKKTITVKKEPSSINGSGNKKTMKQTTINFKKKPSGKNPWESDNDDYSFSNSEKLDDSPVLPKRTVTSRNKTTKKYTLESSEDEEEKFSSSDDEDDFKSVKIDSPQMPKKKPVSKAQPKKVVSLKQGGAKKKTFAFDSDDSGPKIPKKEIKRKGSAVSKPAKKAPPKKKSKVSFSSSEEEASLSDDFSGVDSNSPPAPPRTTTGRSRGTTRKKYTFSDSDSEF